MFALIAWSPGGRSLEERSAFSRLRRKVFGEQHLSCCVPRMVRGMSTTHVRARRHQKVPSSALVLQMGKLNPEPRPLLSQPRLQGYTSPFSLTVKRPRDRFLHPADFSSSSQGGVLPSPHLSQFLPIVWVILQDLSFLLMSKS